MYINSRSSKGLHLRAQANGGIEALGKSLHRPAADRVVSSGSG